MWKTVENQARGMLFNRPKLTQVGFKSLKFLPIDITCLANGNINGGEWHYKPRTQEAEAERALTQGQPVLLTERVLAKKRGRSCHVLWNK